MIHYVRDEVPEGEILDDPVDFGSPHYSYISHNDFIDASSTRPVHEEFPEIKRLMF